MIQKLKGGVLATLSGLTACHCFATDVSNSFSNNNVGKQIAANLMITEADYIDTIPVILTATRTSQPVNTAPAAVTVISREMIVASGLQEVGDLLRLVPGFQVGYFNGISMSLAYHGFTGNYDRRLQVLIDGRSAYMPFLSTVEWLSLPLDISEVEKVEVIRSSNAPVYGANAMQGVINIITRKPFEDEGFMLEGRWGTHDITGTDSNLSDLEWKNIRHKLDDRKYLLRYANSFNELDYRITFGYQKDSGFKNVADTKQLNLLHFVSQYQINTAESLDVQIGARMGDMHTFSYGVDDPIRNKSVESQYQSVSWSRALADSQELKVHFYHNYYDQDDEIRIANVLDWGVYYGTAERFDLELEHVLKAYENIRLMLGAGVRLDRIKSKHLIASENYVNDRSGRVFGNLEWFLTDRFVVNGGVMLEHNEQIGAYYSPRLAMNFLATDEHIFRASVTRAIRSPSILENNVDIAQRTDNGDIIEQLHISQTHLKPERQYSAELGYMFIARNQKLRFDTKLFVEYVRDGILEADECGVSSSPWVWGNNTRANIQGIESQLYYKPHRRFFMNLSHSRTSTNAHYHKCDNWTADLAVDLKDAERDISHTVPKDTFSGLFSFALTPALQWSFTYYYVTEMKWLQDGNIVKEHDRLDTSIDWNKPLPFSSNLNLSVTFQNMLNDYVEIQKETVFEQRAFLKARYEW